VVGGGGSSWGDVIVGGVVGRKGGAVIGGVVGRINGDDGRIPVGKRRPRVISKEIAWLAVKLWFVD
jgi:hypothetical protein